MDLSIHPVDKISMRTCLRLMVQLPATLAILSLAACSPPEIALPYVAQVEAIVPELPGFEVRSTAGGGGELEVVNHTDQEAWLLDEQGRAYVRLGPHGVYEMIGGMWKKVREEPVYYCHDPRLTYSGPPPSSRRASPVKRWIITGRLGEEPFTISGQTVYRPPGTLALLPLGVTAGAVVLGIASFGALMAGTTIVILRKRRSR